MGRPAKLCSFRADGGHSSVSAELFSGPIRIAPLQKPRTKLSVWNCGNTGISPESRSCQISASQYVGVQYGWMELACLGRAVRRLDPSMFDIRLRALVARLRHAAPAATMYLCHENYAPRGALPGWLTCPAAVREFRESV